MPPSRRQKFLRSLLGIGIAAVCRERELVALTERTVHQEDMIRAANRAISLIHLFVAELSRNGVRRVDDDLSTLGWWPDASRTADISFRLMAHTAKGELPVESIDPDAIDLTEIDCNTFDLRRFRPEEYLT
jgi:hypothetical protein